MNLIQAVVITFIASHLTIALLFLPVRSIPKHHGTGWWISASLVLVLSYGFLYNAASQTPDFSLAVSLTAADELGAYFLNMLYMLFIYIGSTAFLNKPLQLKNYAAAFLSLFAVLTYLRLNISAELLADILFSVYCSACACLVFRQHYQKDSKISRVRNILAALCLMIAFHWLNFPFLHNIVSVAPFGFFIAVTICICIFMTLALMVITRFKVQLTESEERAMYVTKHDSLTGLYNRYSLDAIFDEYVKRSQKSKQVFAIIYLDLDGFKSINDTFGHEAGDEVLTIIGQRLVARFTQSGKVVRVGGDEFVVVSEQMMTGSEALNHTFIRGLLSGIEHPIVYNGIEHRVSASIGISFYPLHGEHLDLLLNKADAAMYNAKKYGKNDFSYAPTPHNIHRSCPNDSDQYENILKQPAFLNKMQLNSQGSSPS